MLVSLVDEPICTRKYARAEADTARERFTAELAAGTELKSAPDERLALSDLLAEFDLVGAVHEGDLRKPSVRASGSERSERHASSEGDRREPSIRASGSERSERHASSEGYRVAVGAYLELAADQWGDEWRLVNRRLSDGDVRVTQNELAVLLKQAIRHRIEDGLPLAVPDEIADELDDEVAHLREVLAELDLTRDIDTVVPDLFPPCMKSLLDQVQQGTHLEHHSRFAIATFLTQIGLSTDEIVQLFEVNPGFGEEMTRYQVDHIRGETGPTQYSVPSCATMQSYGDCVNMDDRCERISHPMAYYEGALDDADEDEVMDWREEQDAD